MKLHHRTPVISLCVVLAVFLAGTPLFADQGHMRAALELLQAAKKADQPLPMLKSARKHLENAPKAKGGARAQALQQLNEAVAQATVGDKKKMSQKIDSAIANIHQHMGNAR